MAKGNIRIVDTGGLINVPTYKFQTEAAATAIYAGEPVKLKAAGSPYVIPWADEDITPGTDTNFIGLAASDSTQTATADGSINVYPMTPTMVFEAKAKTGTNVNTQAKIDAMCGDRKIIDLTSTTYTVDDGAADAVGNALFIVGGDPIKQTLKFMVRPYINVVDAA